MPHHHINFFANVFFLLFATILAGTVINESAAADSLVLIAQPVGGHIHPAACVTAKGTIVVTFGQVNHRDLRITRSLDGGRTWETPKPFTHTEKKTFYPGSLTTLSDGRLLHAWNRWNGETDEKEPRYVEFSLSSDDGVTWSPPRALSRNPQAMSVIRHPVWEVSRGEWLFSLSDRTVIFTDATNATRPFGDEQIHGLIPIVRTPKGTYLSGKGLRSTDDGRTWTKVATFPNLAGQGWRHEMVCLKNGWLLASEILGPGFGGEKIRYAISTDDGATWDKQYTYHAPGRAIAGRACPRTVQLDEQTIGVVFYDQSTQRKDGGGVFFLRIPLTNLEKAEPRDPAEKSP